jgi:hypothetical protein
VNRIRRFVLFAALWILGTLAARNPAAQVATGSVVDVLRTVGGPLPLALVELQSTGSAAAAKRQVLTDDGRFRVDRVPPCVYQRRLWRSTRANTRCCWWPLTGCGPPLPG